jgi:hypothetical protein
MILEVVSIYHESSISMNRFSALSFVSHHITLNQNQSRLFRLSFLIYFFPYLKPLISTRSNRMESIYISSGDQCMMCYNPVFFDVSVMDISCMLREK